MKIVFAERLRELMKEQGLNQVRLAEKTGVKQNTISAWLLKKKEPCIFSLWVMADYFEVSVDYLIGREEL
ncbi:MAG: helix-turn-helix transcriptional regulator [Clostridia bacterium]|nr:helix-turn-helix transcriptional regulator [Clostridia bacterium]